LHFGQPGKLKESFARPDECIVVRGEPPETSPGGFPGYPPAGTLNELKRRQAAPALVAELEEPGRRLAAVEQPHGARESARMLARLVRRGPTAWWRQGPPSPQRRNEQRAGGSHGGVSFGRRMVVAGEVQRIRNPLTARRLGDSQIVAAAGATNNLANAMVAIENKSQAALRRMLGRLRLFENHILTG